MPQLRLVGGCADDAWLHFRRLERIHHPVEQRLERRAPTVTTKTDPAQLQMTGLHGVDGIAPFNDQVVMSILLGLILLLVEQADLGMRERRLGFADRFSENSLGQIESDREDDLLLQVGLRFVQFQTDERLGFTKAFRIRLIRHYIQAEGGGTFIPYWYRRYRQGAEPLRQQRQVQSAGRRASAVDDHHTLMLGTAEDLEILLQHREVRKGLVVPFYLET